MFWIGYGATFGSPFSFWLARKLYLAQEFLHKKCIIYLLGGVEAVFSALPLKAEIEAKIAIQEGLRRYFADFCFWQFLHAANASV